MPALPLITYTAASNLWISSAVRPTSPRRGILFPCCTNCAIASPSPGRRAPPYLTICASARGCGIGIGPGGASSIISLNSSASFGSSLVLTLLRAPPLGLPDPWESDRLLFFLLDLEPLRLLLLDLFLLFPSPEPTESSSSLPRDRPRWRRRLSLPLLPRPRSLQRRRCLPSLLEPSDSLESDTLRPGTIPSIPGRHLRGGGGDGLGRG